MDPDTDVAVSPWRIELIVVRDGSHNGGERSSVSRDVERGLFVRLRRGVCVERVAFQAMSEEDQHIVRMRALAAISDAPVVFSHWSAAVLHHVPVLNRRMRLLHTTVSERRSRGQDGVSGHLFALTDQEIVQFGPLLATTIGRTVVDVAGGGTFEEGVMVADAALHAGVEREHLEAAVDLAGPRRAGRRMADVVAFADAGAESAAESQSRVTMFRVGVEPPVLQFRIVLADGSEVFLDFEFPSVGAGGEVDGVKKYLDPTLAKEGAGRAIYREKLREDEVRTRVNGLARWGWVQSGNVALLRPVLARVGVLTAKPRATFADYCARAREGRARWVSRRPRVQR